MKSMLRVSTVAVTFAAFLFAACGKDSTSPDPGISQAVSMEIANELMLMVWSIDFGALGELGFVGDDGIAAAPAGPFELNQSRSVSETVECAQGGTITVDGSITGDLNEAGAGSITIDLRQTPTNCGMNTSQGVFRINGDPNLHVMVSFASADGENLDAYTLAFNGGFKWSGAEGSGSCKMNLDRKSVV